MNFWNQAKQNKGVGSGIIRPSPLAVEDANLAPNPNTPAFGNQPLGPSGNPFGFDNPNLYGSAYQGQNQPATWNGNSYTGPLDQSYQNTARGDQFTGTRDGFLWAAGNRLMPSYGDDARDRLELQTQFGVGGASPSTNPFWQGNYNASFFGAPDAAKPPGAPGDVQTKPPVATPFVNTKDPTSYVPDPGVNTKYPTPYIPDPIFQQPVLANSGAGVKPGSPVVNAMMNRRFKRGFW